MNFFAIILGFISQFLVVRFVIFKTVRIKTRHFEKLYKNSKKTNTKKFILKESLEDKEDSIPSILTGYFMIKDFPWFYISHDEQLMQAGWESKRTVSEIIIFRWKYKNLISITDSYDREENPNISVYISSGNSEKYLGFLQKDKKIKLDIHCSLIEQDFDLNQKTSFLLHGLPGNGKTTIIRNLAKKYGYDLYYIDFLESTTNTDILSLTSYIPNKTIILFEDFDSLYDKRKILKFEKPNFSFDAILNLIDGVTGFHLMTLLVRE